MLPSTLKLATYVPLELVSVMVELAPVLRASKVMLLLLDDWMVVVLVPSTNVPA